ERRYLPQILRQFVLGVLEIMLRLHLHPERSGSSEIFRKPQRRIRRDRRLFSAIRPIRVRGTPIARATAAGDSFIGMRNSSRRTPPGWMGGSRLLILPNIGQ